MPDLTAAQTISNNQQQDSSEKLTENKDSHLNPVRTTLMILLMLVAGFVLVIILGLPIFALWVAFGGSIIIDAAEALASMPSGLLNILPDILFPTEILVFLFWTLVFMIYLFPLALYLNNRFRHNAIIKFYFVARLVTLITLSGAVFFALVSGAKDLKKQRLESFENAQRVKTYLPTTLKGEWTLVNNNIDSGGGVVKAEYSQVDFELQRLRGRGEALDNIKRISMVEIVSPKTDLKCNNEILLELDKQFTVELSISDKRWLTNCEELSISGGKAVITGYEDIVKPQDVLNYHNEFLMVFDKESTRIFLYYEQYLQDYLVSTENWSKSDLIRVVENLRPINAKDFKL